MHAYSELVKSALIIAAGLAAIAGVVWVALSTEPRSSAPPPAPAASAAQAPQPVGADQARDLLAKGALLADVREPIELAETGKLQGALNLPLSGLKQLAGTSSVPAELDGPRDRPIILYCRSGNRSQQAGEILIRRGFTRVYNLGGYEDAVKAGLPAA